LGQGVRSFIPERYIPRLRVGAQAHFVQVGVTLPQGDAADTTSPLLDCLSDSLPPMHVRASRVEPETRMPSSVHERIVCPDLQGPLREEEAVVEGT